MDVTVAAALRAKPDAAKLAALVTRCVHCGFCNAACPTYGLERNELDGPRGRIYLVKQLLEQTASPGVVQRHLDRCLTCRACETACPSGVQYAQIAHGGRQLADREAPRPFAYRLRRRLLIEALRWRPGWRGIAAGARALRWLLPRRLRRTLPAAPERRAQPAPCGPTDIAVFAGCAQEGLMPATNRALAALLARAGHGARLLTEAPCCGALRWHNGQQERALDDVRATVRAGCAALDQGHQAVAFASSGCAAFVTEYPHLAGLSAPQRAQAERLAAKLADPAQLLLARLSAADLKSCGRNKRVAVHCPCTQKHALGLPSATAQLLTQAGYEPLSAAGAPACCGAAGAYLALQRKYAARLRGAMLSSLERPGIDGIVSANIGCVLHLGLGSTVPVRHWLDMLSEDLRDNCQ